MKGEIESGRGAMEVRAGKKSSSSFHFLYIDGLILELAEGLDAESVRVVTATVDL
jgi:hypothetical protein